MRLILIISIVLISAFSKGQEPLGCYDPIKYDKKQRINPNADLVRLHPDSLKKMDFFGNFEWLSEKELNSTGLDIKIVERRDTLSVRIMNKKSSSLYFLNCYELFPIELAGRIPYLTLGYYLGSDLSIHITLNELKPDKSFTYEIPLSNTGLDSLRISVFLVPDINLIKSSIIHIDEDEFLEYSVRHNNTLISSHTYRYNYYESVEVLDKIISLGRNAEKNRR